MEASVGRLEAWSVTRWLKRTLISLLILLLLAAAGLYAVIAGSKGKLSGEVSVAGLEQPVSIHLDDLGRPHVQAQNLADALAAQGYLHGSERLWQMELFRRAGQGRLAALFGSDMVEADIELWRMGVPQLGQQLQQHASDSMKQWVTAYVAGINQAIELQRSRPLELWLLQGEISPWTESDVFAVGALIAFNSANNHKNELLRLALAQALTPAQFERFLDDGSDTAGFPFILAGEGESQALLSPSAMLDPMDNPNIPRLRFGSNGWVVAPDKTAEGQALFAFDSHDYLGLPNLFYEVHLHFGQQQIRGWSVPGLPGVINGYNDKIAWGFTNIGDTQDLFIETRHPDKPDHFLLDGQWLPAEVSQHSLPVKGSAPVAFTITRTHNGPLIREEPLLSFRWTMHQFDQFADSGMGLEGLLMLNLATDWDSFTAAIDRHAAPTLNATYADSDGNIGFRTAGLIPERGLGEGLYPLDGSRSEHQWQGMVPVTEMPRRYNPPEGFLAAANARVNPRGVGPMVSADNAAPYRIARLQQVLAEDNAITFEQMQRWQMDWHDGQAQALLPALLRQAQAGGVDQDARFAEGISLLKAWQTQPLADTDSAAALIFQQWYLQIADAVFAQPLGEFLYGQLLKRNYVLNFALDGLILEAEDPQWWVEGRDDMVANALAHTLASLHGELGGEPRTWRLDQKQSVALPHEIGKAVPALGRWLNGEQQPWGGTPAAVGRASYRYDRPFKVSHGATVRVVAQMGEQVKAASVIPGGQSGHPLSPHYRDQYDLWREGQLIPVEDAPASAPQLTLLPLE